ncbi:MAG: hypothetical protein R2932_12905 [Caldilineaceae bacterium]
MRLALGLLFGLGASPILYYGTEVGLSQPVPKGRGAARHPMIWETSAARSRAVRLLQNADRHLAGTSGIGVGDSILLLDEATMCSRRAQPRWGSSLSAINVGDTVQPVLL